MVTFKLPFPTSGGTDEWEKFFQSEVLAKRDAHPCLKSYHWRQENQAGGSCCTKASVINTFKRQHPRCKRSSNLWVFESKRPTGDLQHLTRPPISLLM